MNMNSNLQVLVHDLDLVLHEEDLVLMVVSALQHLLILFYVLELARY